MGRLSVLKERRCLASCAGSVATRRLCQRG